MARTSPASCASGMRARLYLIFDGAQGTALACKVFTRSRIRGDTGMGVGSLKDLYFDELGDLHDAETQLIRVLPRLAEAARAPELREALTRHYEESRLHLARLDLIFTHW